MSRNRTEEIVGHIKQGIREYNETSTKVYEIHASIGSYTDCVRGHTPDYFPIKADDLMYARKAAHKESMGLVRWAGEKKGDVKGPAFSSWLFYCGAK